MAKGTPGKEDSFDLDQLRQLIQMMDDHDLTEVKIQKGTEKWQLRRGPREVMPMLPPAGTFLPQPAVAPSAAPAVEKTSTNDLTINCPVVGTFYEAPTPDDPPFVKVGAEVNAETIVCIVEAMKVFNQIPAELSGTIAEVLVKNGDAVDFGQPLYRLTP